jgi:hypothetical protein
MLMPTDEAREAAIAWKKASLKKLQQTIAVAREFNSNFKKLCDSIKAVAKDVSRGGDQIARQYDRYLDEESERYEQDADAMSALQEVPLADEQVDDVKLQVGESLEGLLSHLDEILLAVREVKP